MLRVKVFLQQLDRLYHHISDAEDKLQERINGWLSSVEEAIDIIQIVQSSSDSVITVTILYTDKTVK